MSGGDAHDLTGSWTGVYFYPLDPEFNPHDELPPTPFSAVLRDVGGQVTGSTLEPDLTGPPGSPDIPARLEGERLGSRLGFTKFPEGGGQTHTIDYEGEIAPDGDSVSGRWIIHGDWSGTLRMQRRLAAVEAAAKFAEGISR